MKAAWTLLAAHALACVFGLAGLLVAVPNPELWQHSAAGQSIFALGMRHGGAVQNALGAAAMLAFGLACLGPRRTLVFLAVSVVVSLTAELVGTATGWPFGAYAYTEGLGPAIAGRVPLTIPLSWFSLGLASYLLGRALAARAGLPGSWLAVALGAWLLVACDLALDPAMSHPAQPVAFWRWGESGMYLGMPVVNFAGWLATGALFMAPAHALWGRAAEPGARFPLLVYGLSLGFAIALDAAAGLWLPVLLALALGALPATAAAWRPARAPAGRAHEVGA
jgi:putative membrane protein